MKNITLFWNWIQYNQHTLKNLRNEKPKIQKLFLFWLEKHLHNYCEELDSIIIYPKKNNQPIQLVISSNGNPDYFSKVTKLVQHAPTLANWKFIAFIQPSQDLKELEAGLDKPYVFKDIVLKASDLKCLPLQYENERKIDMIVFLKNFTVLCHNQNLIQVILIIMQDILGEKALYENINFVEVCDFPADEDCTEMIHLHELQFYIDQLSRQNNK